MLSHSVYVPALSETPMNHFLGNHTAGDSLKALVAFFSKQWVPFRSHTIQVKKITDIVCKGQFNWTNILVFKLPLVK